MGKIVFDTLADAAKYVRYGKDDIPNKYGFTRKMCTINDLVSDEKPLESADFEPNDYDRAYYDDMKFEYDIINRGRAKKIRLMCFYNE